MRAAFNASLGGYKRTEGRTLPEDLIKAGKVSDKYYIFGRADFHSVNLPGNQGTTFLLTAIFEKAMTNAEYARRGGMRFTNLPEDQKILTVIYYDYHALGRATEQLKRDPRSNKSKPAQLKQMRQYELGLEALRAVNATPQTFRQLIQDFSARQGALAVELGPVIVSPSPAIEIFSDIPEADLT